MSSTQDTDQQSTSNPHPQHLCTTFPSSRYDLFPPPYRPSNLLPPTYINKPSISRPVTIQRYGGPLPATPPPWSLPAHDSQQGTTTHNQYLPSLNEAAGEQGPPRELLIHALPGCPLRQPPPSGWFQLVDFTGKPWENVFAAPADPRHGFLVWGYWGYLNATTGESGPYRVVDSHLLLGAEKVIPPPPNWYKVVTSIGKVKLWENMFASPAHPEHGYLCWQYIGCIPFPGHETQPTAMSNTSEAVSKVDPRLSSTITEHYGDEQSTTFEVKEKYAKEKLRQIQEQVESILPTLDTESRLTMYRNIALRRRRDERVKQTTMERTSRALDH